MKIILITLCLCSIISICKSGRIENDFEAITSTIPSNASDRKLLVFPKHKKFLITTQNTNNKEVHTYKESYGTRKPLMAKIVPKLKKHSLQTIEATRKPLMKARNLTIKMASKNISNGNESENKNLSKNINIETTAEKHNINTDKLVQINANKDIFFKEEVKDRNEFIFLEKTKDIVYNDLINTKEEEFETTTTSLKLNSRRKRNSNIIVEENMGTTVSTLKYTGRDSRLTNELYFKNINH